MITTKTTTTTSTASATAAATITNAPAPAPAPALATSAASYHYACYLHYDDNDANDKDFGLGHGLALLSVVLRVAACFDTPGPLLGFGLENTVKIVESCSFKSIHEYTIKPYYAGSLNASLAKRKALQPLKHTKLKGGACPCLSTVTLEKSFRVYILGWDALKKQDLAGTWLLGIQGEFLGERRRGDGTLGHHKVPGRPRPPPSKSGFCGLGFGFHGLACVWEYVDQARPKVTVIVYFSYSTSLLKGHCSCKCAYTCRDRGSIFENCPYS